MKTTSFLRTILLLGVLALNSCSENNEAETQLTPTILVKKKIITYSANDVVTINYKYDGNKIISRSTDGGFIATYTYTGDVITMIEERVDDKFQRSYEYIYLNGKVAKEIEKDNWETDSRIYTYNANGTVSYVRNRTGGQSTTGLLTFENGNLVKNEEGNSTYIFGYDTKNNPFKNVLGFNLLFDTNTDMFSRNNMTQDGSSGYSTDYYTFNYDANGFPTERNNNDMVGSFGGDLYQYFY